MSVRFHWVLAATLCGCFSKPRFGDDTSANGVWGEPVAISELDFQVTGEPTITDDLTTLYWATQITSMSWVLGGARRATTSEGFAVITVDFGGATIDQDPSVTSDGRLMVYLTDQGGLAYATWNQGAGALSPAGQVPGLAGVTGATSLDLSGDGKTLYYNVGTELWFATRARTIDNFMPMKSLGSGFFNPAISGDELTIYYGNVGGTPRGVKYATRSQKGSAFLPQGDVFTEFKDPDVSADDQTMVVAIDDKQTIGISHRVQP